MERNTRQREAIRKTLLDARRPLLPSEILDYAQSHAQGTSLATVYRNLKALVKEGALQAVTLPGENQRFELAGQDHHHHFQCTRCQAVFDIHACPGDLRHLLPKGFALESHDLTLYGYCAPCMGKSTKTARGSKRPPVQPKH